MLKKPWGDSPSSDPYFYLFGVDQRRNLFVSEDLPSLGDACEDECLSSSNSVCNNVTCVCPPQFPVDVKQKKACFKGK